MRGSYKKVIEKFYPRPDATDNPDYEYSLRNPKGFYQKMVVLRNLVEILNRNKIKLGKFNSILDLGCGVGWWLRTIAEIRGSAEGLVGIDLSENRLTCARRINKDIKWIKADMCNLPFQDESFDFIMAFVSFMFLTDDRDLERGINEAARVLKNGGYFLFYDVLGRWNLSERTRAFRVEEIKDLFAKRRLRLIHRQGCFSYILIRRFSTAYLASKIPMEILFLLERFPIFRPNNMFLLFKKTS